MTKKEQCKGLMLKFFGPASAAVVDGYSEDLLTVSC